MISELEKDVYRTIAYFSYFNYPVTVFEIYKWQLSPEKVQSFFEITSVLDSSIWLSSKVVVKNGFYGLGDVSEQVRTRHDRFLNAVEKYKKLKKVLSYVARIPSVKGVALCNSLPLHFTREQSDIDLFIITENNKVWSTRLMSVLPMILMKQRPGEVKVNPVDMSFFAEESVIDFESMKIDKFDPYMSVWLRTLVPVYEKEVGVFERLIKNNAWAEKELPASRIAVRSFREKSLVRRKFPVSIPEKVAKMIQIKKFPVEIRDGQNQDSRIIVSDKILKFHKNDRREEIARVLTAKMHL